MPFFSVGVKLASWHCSASTCHLLSLLHSVYVIGGVSLPVYLLWLGPVRSEYGPNLLLQYVSHQLIPISLLGPDHIGQTRSI